MPHDLHISRPGPLSRTAGVSLALLAWVAAIVGGALCAERYAATPGTIHGGATRWPGNGACSLSSARPTLLMFAHPRCPCTRASLEELLILASHCPNQF